MYKIITEDLNWMGMPHWVCIGNWAVASIIILLRLSVAFNYYKFVEINKRIRAYNTGINQLQTTETFKWFSKVFTSCANMRLANILTFFIGIYWLEVIFDGINAWNIQKAKRVYRSQESHFKQKLFSFDDFQHMVEAEREVIKSYLNRLSELTEDQKADLVKRLDKVISKTIKVK